MSTEIIYFLDIYSKVYPLGLNSPLKEIISEFEETLKKISGSEISENHLRYLLDRLKTLTFLIAHLSHDQSLISNVEYFPINFLNKKIKGKGYEAYGYTIKHMLHALASQYKCNHFLEDDKIFSEEFLKEQCPGGPQGHTNLHQLFINAVCHKNHSIFLNEKIFSKDFWKAQSPTKENEGFTNLHQLLLQAVGRGNIELILNEEIFKETFLNAQAPHEFPGCTNRHRIILDAFVYDKIKEVVFSKELFSQEFWGTLSPDEEAGDSTNLQQLLFIAVNFNKNDLILNEEVFSQEFLDSPSFRPPYHLSNRHQLLFDLLDAQNKLIENKKLFPEDVWVSKFPGQNQNITIRHKFIEKAAQFNVAWLFKETIVPKLFWEEKTLKMDAPDYKNKHLLVRCLREGAKKNNIKRQLKDYLSEFNNLISDIQLTSISFEDRIFLNELNRPDLLNKLKKLKNKTLLEVRETNLKLIKDYLTQNKLLEDKGRLIKFLEYLETYKVESNIDCLDLGYDSKVAYLNEETEFPYSIDELEKILATTSFSPMTRLYVRPQDIHFGWPLSMIKASIKGFEEKEEERLNALKKIEEENRLKAEIKTAEERLESEKKAERWNFLFSKLSFNKSNRSSNFNEVNYKNNERVELKKEDAEEIKKTEITKGLMGTLFGKFSVSGSKNSNNPIPGKNSDEKEGKKNNKGYDF